MSRFCTWPCRNVLLLKVGLFSTVDFIYCHVLVRCRNDLLQAVRPMKRGREYDDEQDVSWKKMRVDYDESPLSSFGHMASPPLTSSERLVVAIFFELE